MPLTSTLGMVSKAMQQPRSAPTLTPCFFHSRFIVEHDLCILSIANLLGLEHDSIDLKSLTLMNQMRMLSDQERASFVLSCVVLAAVPLP